MRDPLLRLVLILLASSIFSSARGASVSDRYLTTSDRARLHYLEAGKGENTLVFVPGWMMPAAVFENQLTDLSREFRVIAFDPRAHGKSEVHGGPYTPERRSLDLHELLQEARVKSCILAGWSLGVMEVLDYLAKHHPHNVRGLLLIDNSIGEGTPPRPSKSSGSSTANREERMRAFTGSLTRKPLSPSMFDTIYKSTLRIPQNVASELVNKPFPREYWRDTLLSQKVPILYAIRPRYAGQGEALHAKRPKLASVEIFPEAGHALFLDEPERFNQLTAEFARRVFRSSP
jgi:non-heme chloroperoxidase